jgi:hypothetical protein
VLPRSLMLTAALAGTPAAPAFARQSCLGVITRNVCDPQRFEVGCQHKGAKFRFTGLYDSKVACPVPMGYCVPADAVRWITPCKRTAD